MPKTDAKTKNKRLYEVQVFALNRPNGFRTAELAKHLGVSERTVRRYIAELDAVGQLPVYKEGQLWHLVEGARFDLMPVRLNLNEALALYLAARLLSSHSDKHNPNVVSALNKLASAMPPPIGEHIVRTAGVAGRRKSYPDYLHTLETLTLAWAKQKRVRLVYHKPPSKEYPKGEITERLFDTYFVEPSLVGYACYVIGHDHTQGDIRIFKVERIIGIELLAISYDIRTDFDPYKYLTHAWGVMGGNEIIEVKLRFSPGVTYRIRESDWPGVLRVEDNPDGGCTMTLRVNHTLEMKPWIRGWGPDCEVLEPPELRREIAAEMKAAGAVYGRDESGNFDKME